MRWGPVFLVLGGVAVSCASLESLTGGTPDAGTDAAGEGGVDAASDAATDSSAEVCPAGFASCGAVSTACETPISQNALHCGGCNHPCGAAACADGVCAPTVIATDQANPTTLALDSVNVYWGAADTGFFARAPKGGGPVTILATEVKQPTAISVGPRGVYLTAYFGSGLRRFDFDAGADASSEVLDTCNTATGVAADDTHVYWQTYSCGGTGRLRVLDVASSDASDYVLPFPHECSSSVFVAKDSVYLAANSQVITFDTNTKELRTISDAGADKVLRFAVAPYGIYAVMKTTSNLVRVDLLDRTGLFVRTVATFGKNGVADVAVGNDDYVYIATGSSVLRVSRDGRQTVTLAKDTKSAALAVDDAFAYWTDTGTQQIARVAR